MNKSWMIVLAIVIIGSLSAFILWNRDTQPLSDVGLENKDLDLSVKQVENDWDVELSGQVIDGLTKQPIAAKIKIRNGAQVIATADCNAAGEFRVSLKDGEYEITVEHPHYVTKGKYDVDRLVEIDGESVELEATELWPESIVKGRVVSGSRGVEAELQFIYQKDNSGAKYYLFNSIKTDQNGYFTLDKAYGGIQNIRVIADNFVSQKLSDITLTPGETVDVGEIPMEMGLTVFGVVKDKSTEKGISGALVLCVDLNKKIVAETKTSDNGSYALPAIELNKFRIIIIADGFHSNSMFLESQSQNRHEHNVAMTKQPEIKLAQNSDVQAPERDDANETLSQQNDEQETEPTEEEILEGIEYKNKVQSVVRENIDQISDCYEDLLAVEAASGQIVFNFMASSSGDVFHIKINNTEIHNEAFIECLSDVIANFHFPKRTSVMLTEIEYPFVFGSQ